MLNKTLKVVLLIVGILALLIITASGIITFLFQRSATRQPIEQGFKKEFSSPDISQVDSLDGSWGGGFMDHINYISFHTNEKVSLDRTNHTWNLGATSTTAANDQFKQLSKYFPERKLDLVDINNFEIFGYVGYPRPNENSNGKLVSEWLFHNTKSNFYYYVYKAF